MTRWQCCVLLWHGDDITKKKLMKTVSLLVQYIWNCSNWKYRMFCDKPWILLNFVLQVEIRAQASETDISGIFSYLRKKQAFLYPPPPPRKLCLWGVYCFQVVHLSVHLFVLSATFFFFNILKRQWWNFIKFGKNMLISTRWTFIIKNKG